MTYNDPGEQERNRKRRKYSKPTPPEQTDAFAGTSTPPQPVRTPSLGERRKDRELANHETRHEDRLAFVRDRLKRLYRKRLAEYTQAGTSEHAGVSADDAHAILKANANLGYLDDDEAKPWFGAIFRERGWRRTGKWVPSLRDSNNGRLLPTWKWEGA